MIQKEDPLRIDEEYAARIVIEALKQSSIPPSKTDMILRQIISAFRNLEDALEEGQALPFPFIRPDELDKHYWLVRTNEGLIITEKFPLKTA